MTNLSRRAIMLLSLLMASFMTACGGGGDDMPVDLRTIDTVVGSGAVAASGNTLTVNYTGWVFKPGAPNSLGAQFDTSSGKQPFQFILGAGKVITGWDQGIVGMKVGGTRTLIIPSALAYGSTGSGTLIPPDTALVFTVTLLALQ